MSKKKKIILDTSVIVKWFVNEAESEKANELLQEVRIGSFSLVIPDIVLVEIVNALRFTQAVDEKQCQSHIQNLLNLKSEIFFTTEVIGRIVSLVYRSGLASYDALYVAAAEDLDILLITADYKHHRKEISKHIQWLSTLDIKTLR